MLDNIICSHNKQIGFVIENLSSNQTAYQLLRNINKHIAEKNSCNFIIFQRDIFLPCVNPECAIYRTSDEAMFYGHLVVCSPSCLDFLKTTYTTKKYWYMTDLSWMKDRDRYQTYLEDKNVIKLVRAKDYVKPLEDLGLKDIMVIEEFNVEEFERLLND